MGQHELLEFLVDVCIRLRLRYFITGSMASMTYGEFRLTNDIDVVIDFRYGDILPFKQAFPPEEFYLSEDAMRAAIHGARQFNIIHVTSGLKIDVIVSDLSPYDLTRFERAVDEPLREGRAMKLASAEDVILKKLVYYELGGSEKHIRDITSMLRVMADRIDHAYIESWVERLGVRPAWKMILEKLRAAGD
jgi:hypothetical protein